MADHDVPAVGATEVTEDGSVTPAGPEDGDNPVRDADIPTSLTLEEAFRAAFFMIGIYGDIESWKSEEIVLLSE